MQKFALTRWTRRATAVDVFVAAAVDVFAAAAVLLLLSLSLLVPFSFLTMFFYCCCYCCIDNLAPAKQLLTDYGATRD